MPLKGGALQLSAYLNKIVIEKKRNIRVTCCEFCSHFVIVLLLSAGYALTVIEVFGPHVYSGLSIVLPEGLIGIVKNQYAPPTGNEDPEKIYYEHGLLDGPLFVPTFDQFIATSRFISNSVGDQSGLIGQFSFGQELTNLLYYGNLHFAPSGPYVDSFITYLNTTYVEFKNVDYFIHESEDAGIDYILQTTDNQALALIVLRQVTPEKVNYVIRQNYTALPNTNVVFNEDVIGLNTEYQRYLLSGFMTLQRTVDEWVFWYINDGRTNTTTTADGSLLSEDTSELPTCVLPTNVAFTPFPTFAYNQNPFYPQVGFLLGVGLVMATMYPMARLSKSVVEEKETRMREVMKIMGLRDWVHQLGWFISGFVLYFWIALSTTFVAKATFLIKSDIRLLFIYFFLFCMSELALAFLVSVFFSNSKLAAIAAPVVLFAALVPRFAFFTSNKNEFFTMKAIVCLLSPTAFGFGADIITTLEYAEVGVQFSNVFTGRLNFAFCLAMMLLDFFLYGLLALYLDQVLPTEHGTSKHPLFFLDKHYWCGGSKRSSSGDANRSEDGSYLLHDLPDFALEAPVEREGNFYNTINSSSSGISSNNSSSGSNGSGSIGSGGDGSGSVGSSGGDGSGNNSSIEILPEECRAQAKVQIKHLKKRYPAGNVAVKDVSMSMLEGQITCLLGHNGAGKSTTIAALTGLVELTAGEVSIYGKSLTDDLQAIRQMTGICPQHNCLFPTLTVAEHLRMFGKIKGHNGPALEVEITDMIQEVGLSEKRHVISSALSGGMKRKLCLAMALMGDPKFVLLDEPTSGMDPYSRRSTWELLQKCKAGRVVLLTTHFMEEADTLADRIAIMSAGQLVCCGSSLFLKSRFGLGYLLSVCKVDRKTPFQPIADMVIGVIPTAKVNSSIAGELVFQLPLDTVSQFPALFTQIDRDAKLLGIDSYGLSVTTLERVFISLLHEKHLNEKANGADPVDEEYEPPSGITGQLLKAAQSATGLIHRVIDVASLKVGRMMVSSNSQRQPTSVIPRRRSFDPSLDKLALMGDSDVEEVPYHFNSANSNQPTTPHQNYSHKYSLTDSQAKQLNPVEASDEYPVDAPQSKYPLSVELTALQKKSPANETDAFGAHGFIAEPSVFVSSGHGRKQTCCVYTNDPTGGANYRSENESDGLIVEEFSSHHKSPRERDCKVGYSSVPSANEELHSIPISASAVPMNVEATHTRKEGIRKYEEYLADPSSDYSSQSVESDTDKLNAVVKERSCGSIFVVQFVELFRKRLIIASRDIKGLFFQVLFPALQIFLVLFLLTLDLNPAGNTMKLNAEMFARSEAGEMSRTMITPGNGIASASSSTQKYLMESPYMITELSNASNSTGMSLYMLDPATFEDNRYGAFVTNDRIDVNATIQWWALGNIEITDQTIPYSVLKQLSGLVGLSDLLTVNTTAEGLSINVGELFNVSDIIGNVEDALNSTIEEFLLEQFNITVGEALHQLLIGNVTGNDVTIETPDIHVQFVVDSLYVTVLNFSSKDLQLCYYDASIALTNLYIRVIDNGTSTTTAEGEVTINVPNACLPLPASSNAQVDLTMDYTIMHNTTSPHGMSAFAAELTASAFKACSPMKGDAIYLTKNHPLPITAAQSIELKVILALLASIFVLVPLCYIPASFVSFVVKERVCKSKHLQIVSSVSPFLYWTATYAWDMLLFSILVCFVLIILFIFGKNTAAIFISTQESTWCVFLLLFLYGSSSVAISYIYSLAFENFSTAQISIMGINFVTGFVFVLGYFIMINVEATRAAGEQLVHFFRLFPPYNVGEGLINLSANYYYNNLFSGRTSCFEWKVCGRSLTFMAAETVFYFSALLMTEVTFFRRFLYYLDRKRVAAFSTSVPVSISQGEERVMKQVNEQVVVLGDGTASPSSRQSSSKGLLWSDGSSGGSCGGSSGDGSGDDGSGGGSNGDTMPSVVESRESAKASSTTTTLPSSSHTDGFKFDREVLAEADRVKEGLHHVDDYSLLVHELNKTYPPSILGGQPKYAVRGVSFACENGERFGLLGINGAGKTTTLSILTSDMQPTSGEIYIGGQHLSNPETQTMIGYCPQVDPLLELLNAYETLWFFGRIRGIPKDLLDARIKGLIKQVDLTKFAHRPCGTYSGGNKRKLSLAVALIGNPRVLILDEPSTGMDPEAKRQMWTIIEKVSSERSVVLVSHSMEEVEALCTRLCVMVSGRLQCIGSPQHLKSRFGGGYQVEVRSNLSTVQDCLTLCRFLMPTAKVDELHGGYFRLQVPKDGINLPNVFNELQGNKERLQIFDYNISQSTLEQVFIQFAAAQEEETSAIAGMAITAAKDVQPLSSGEGGGDSGGGREENEGGLGVELSVLSQQQQQQYGEQPLEVIHV